ncbi:HlyD family type I secretion periplasmic adaptor subunit [Vreelandella olivaria]|uniref:HlyD family type I secretion periplasmic adaptor subunit n=1 Tax=Vreelandella olivaria TaxID=390919 RepID=UPI00201F63B5|nr:HlyD family type I secretion periplasmic adaptor subunit [Halomonas olivaria]
MIRHPFPLSPQAPGTTAPPDWQALATRRTRKPWRLGGGCLLVGLLLFVAWAAWAPLDNGIAVPATVVVSGNRQAVEHPTGGTVERLWVREGDQVTQGQPLVSIDTTRLQNEAEVLRLQHASALAEMARLEAERDQQDSITIPPALAHTGDIEIDTLLALQRQLFASRRSALAAELSGLEASLDGQRARAAGLEASLAQQRARLSVLREQRDNLRELASGGYIPRNRLLEFEGSYAQLQGDIASESGTLQQTLRQMDELQLRLTQRSEEYQRDVRDALAQARLRSQEVAGRLENNTYDIEHALIRAPRSGQVVGLTLHTEGGVVPPGGLLMEIVPQDEPLLVEGQLPVDQIDRVQAGLPVELAFTAFERSSTPRIPGTVKQVSADRLVDDISGLPYYRLYIEVTSEDLSPLGNAPLKAGMPVEAFVRTGERSLLNYLFKPLFDRARTAWGDA